MSAADIPSAGTALNVLDSYSLDLKLFVSFVLLITGVMIVIALELKRIEIINRHVKKVVLRDMGMIVCSSLFIYYVFFSSFSFKPANTTQWIWRDQYWKNGYTVSSIESIQRFYNVMLMPEDYSAAYVSELAEEWKKDQDIGDSDTRDTLLTTAAPEVKPDIILILNEAFYDFSVLGEYSTSIEVMPFIDSLPSNTKGHVVVPTSGGGTNRSEYELLTGNSLYLMPDILPFWSLNLKDSYSMVSVLEAQGYSTLAYHCGEEKNYKRNTAYPDMGFDESYFLNDMEEYEAAHGSFCSDQSNYEFLIEQYEARDTSKPFFGYNLTIQNHVSDDPNIEMLAYATSGFDDPPVYVDMYFSCLKKSDSAFQYLTDYFSKVERPVIICMLGDHAPFFVDTFNHDSNLLPEQVNLYAKATPLILWSNYQLDIQLNELTSLPYIAPMLLELAGLEMPPYYAYMNEMEEKIPVLSAFNFYTDQEGNIVNYTDDQADSSYKALLRDYWYMEYNGVGENPRKRVQELFELPLKLD